MPCAASSCTRSTASRAGKSCSCRFLPRQISGRRAACPPARRPRRELRSARRLEARPGPAGLAAASNRSGCLCVAPARPAAPAISHAILSDVFHGLKFGCWNPADSALVWGRDGLELHAELGEFPVSLVELVAQGCTTWVGIALPSCRCNAVLSGALVPYLVHRFAVVKLVTPFRPCVSAGLKPASPLLA